MEELKGSPNVDATEFVEDTGHGEQAVDSTDLYAIDIINDRYGWDRSSCDAECEDEYETAVDGIVIITDEVINLRQSRGLKRYYEIPVNHTGKTTGVQLKYMSSIRRNHRTTFIGKGSAFGDAEAEVRLTY